MAKLKASWIWCPPHRPVYTQTILARKTFTLSAVRDATLRITADTRYRLKINGRWVADGPARSWPEHYQYDVIDATAYLQSGVNTIEVVARYYGCGTFHQVPQQPGLLAQLDVTLANGRRRIIATDATWQTARLRAYAADVPKIAGQMPPLEWYDARVKSTRFTKAHVVCTANGGPWKDLHPRDVALLTHRPVSPRAFGGANVVTHAAVRHFCFDAMTITGAPRVELDISTAHAFGVATLLTLKKAVRVTIEGGFNVAVDGRRNKSNTFNLSAGRHLLVAMVAAPLGQNHARHLNITDVPGMTLSNPLNARHENPWCRLYRPGWRWDGNDNQRQKQPGRNEYLKNYRADMDDILAACSDAAALRKHMGRAARTMPSKTMLLRNNNWMFQTREVLGDATKLVDDPTAVLHDTAAVTTVHPAPDGDVELMVDFGDQFSGCWTFELIADAGVTVDVTGVEYVDPQGRPQHTGGQSNILTYVTADGVNRYTSLMRRSGRYLYLTLRDAKRPVRIRHVGVVESLYPANLVGNFDCSDARLRRIWDISLRTLELCMEDAFVDCPLYEQTLWVGDARNEGLYAMDVFGATDIVRRCITLAGQSLEHHPLVGSQVPSTWYARLPAWSFLWGISVWDYYYNSGDAAFARQVWPWVMSNLRGAKDHCTDRGLFSGDYWNMFDWSGADQEHQTVLHNSLLLVGAIDAALELADELGRKKDAAWLHSFRKQLVAAVNAVWDRRKQSLPDSIHADGTPSNTTCRHTNYLAVLYDVLGGTKRKAAERHTLTPPKGMVDVGSPFAMHYLYEAMDKLGRQDDIVRSIYDKFLPMLAAGATTVWETFPGFYGDRQLTRSHCHAWSSAPLYFLPRVVLGIRQTAVGGAAYTVSPRLGDLEWAAGTLATARGPLSVRWDRHGRKLEVVIAAPDGVKATFQRNDTHRGLDVAVRYE